MAGEFRCGVIAVIGRPNVGKSTLVNALVRHDISITSEHSHTTRHQIRAIDNDKEFQAIYVDTPGIHKAKGAYGERLNDSAYDALIGADVVLPIFDASATWGKGDEFIAETIRGKSNVLVVANKCDTLGGSEKVATYLHTLSENIVDANDIFPISAFTKKNVGHLREEIIKRLPPGHALFDTSTSHDLSDDVLVAECMRESVLRNVRDELPQAIAVIAREDQSENPNIRNFDVRILVSKKSHKPIVIGSGGSVLEQSASRARQRAEAILGTQLFFRTRVVIDEDWQSRPDQLDSHFA
jgi:GTP-binding protein Era